LLGYKVSFVGEAHLRWLFGEIFMDASYFFRTDNDRPLIFDCGSNVETHPVAMGDHSRQIELFRDPSPGSSSLKMSTLRQRHDGPGVVVPSRRLSEFI
jgi:hypothetical protein